VNPAGAQIDDLLPHRGRLKLVDEILEVNERSAVTRSTVSDRWPFFKRDRVHSLVCIELVAQTAGITNSWKGFEKHGPKFVNRGWLVGIKSAVFYVDALELDKRIITRSRNAFEYEGFREILGTVEDEAQIFAEVRLQLLQSGGDTPA